MIARVLFLLVRVGKLDYPDDRWRYLGRPGLSPPNEPNGQKVKFSDPSPETAVESVGTVLGNHRVI